MSKKERIEQLVSEIRRHRELYYNQVPEISDSEFDLLENELLALDPSHPVLAEVGVPLGKARTGI